MKIHEEETQEKQDWKKSLDDANTRMHQTLKDLQNLDNSSKNKDQTITPEDIQLLLQDIDQLSQPQSIDTLYTSMQKSSNSLPIYSQGLPWYNYSSKNILKKV